MYDTPECVTMYERTVCVLRYHARSLTALVSTMSAHSLIQAGPSNFAPDLDSAVRVARRAIDSAVLEAEAERAKSETQNA